MTDSKNMRLAANVIAYGSAASPAKFPRDDEMVLKVWADVLGTVNVPEGVWPDAVRYWAATAHGDRMAGPWEILEAARQVVKQWERDSSKKYILEAHRWQHRVARAKRNYGSQFALHKVVPPPQWSGIDTSQDPTGGDPVAIARDGWRRAQGKQPAREVPSPEFFARLKRSAEGSNVDEVLKSGPTGGEEHAQNGPQEPR